MTNGEGGNAPSLIHKKKREVCIMKIVADVVIKKEIEVDDKFKVMNALAARCDDRWDSLADELEAIVREAISGTDNIGYLSGIYEKDDDEPIMEW